MVTPCGVSPAATVVTVPADKSMTLAEFAPPLEVTTLVPEGLMSMLFGLSPTLKVAVILGSSAAAAAETETPIPSAAVTATHINAFRMSCLINCPHPIFEVQRSNEESRRAQYEVHLHARALRRQNGKDNKPDHRRKM